MANLHEEQQQQKEAGEYDHLPLFHTRDLILGEDVKAKAKELADLLGSSDEVRTFQKAERQINEHPEIQQLIATMKKKQKEIVAFESFNNTEMVAKIEREIDELQDQLDLYPIVEQFRQSQTDINYVLQLVMNIVRNTVAEKINVETGSEIVE